MSTDVLGLIGGSGLYQIPELVIDRIEHTSTPFGEASAPLIYGGIHDQPVVFLARHGSGHTLTPSELPYRANVYALKQAGVTHLLTVSAVGSLREGLPPLAAVLPDQIIDRTTIRPRSFFGDGVVAHVGLADPFCDALQAQVQRASRAAGQDVSMGGTYICIEGPQFSTKAESMLFRSWNAAVIGMTAMPEARLAREAELCYATLALVTDYDVWHESGAVSVETVIEYLHRNVAVARSIVVELCKMGLPFRTCRCGDALQNAIITDPAAISASARNKLGIIGDRYLPPVSPADLQ